MNQINMDAFMEMARAGLASANKAIEILVPDMLDMDVLWVGSMPTQKLSEITGDPEDLVAGAYIYVKGDMPGHALLMFRRNSALLMADMMLGRPAHTTTELGQLEESVIQEFANILISSYLSAIANHCNITLMPSPPLIAQDMSASLVTVVLASSGQLDIETLSIVTAFKCGGEDADGFFLYIPEKSEIMKQQVAKWTKSS